MPGPLYRILRTALFALPPDDSHTLAGTSLRLAGAQPGVRGLGYTELGTVTPLEEAAADYLAGLEHLYRYADYLVSMSRVPTPQAWSGVSAGGWSHICGA